jgi:hypothetical protein
MATKPKLALIPSAYKAGKVYSVLPADGTGDFDNFSRGTTATRVNKDGLIETVGSNVPRINYPMIDGVVSGCPSLLLEPARTNLVQYSEDFTSWTNSSSYITSDYGISPDGSQNASRLLFTGTSQTLSKNIGTNGTLSYSIYVKGVKGETINISMASGSDENFLLNGEWQRLSYSDTVSNSTININTFGNKTARDLLIWGAQLEVGSYPTSYIPTNGSSVTRSAETCNNSGDANTFNDSEGVLFAEISALANGGTSRRISLNDESGTVNNRVSLELDENLNTIKVFMISNSVFVGGITITNIDQRQNNKIAIKYNISSLDLYVNGFLKDTDNTISSMPIGLSSLYFSEAEGSFDFEGNIKQIQYFDKALTDAELQALTTI